MITIVSHSVTIQFDKKCYNHFLMRSTIEIPNLGKFTLIDATNDVGCVDPRRDRSGNRPVGAARSAGASAGKTMALMGVRPDITVARAVRLVAQSEHEQGHKYTQHVDTHTHGLGCGHIARASEEKHEALYGIPSEGVIDMRVTALEFWDTDRLELYAPKLVSTHREAGVVIVNSPDYTIDPLSVPQELEVFRYDRLRTHTSLTILAESIGGKDGTVEPEELITVFERQTMATLALLGPQLPIYHVVPETKMVAHLGSVPTREEFLLSR